MTREDETQLADLRIDQRLAWALTAVYLFLVVTNVIHNPYYTLPPALYPERWTGRNPVITHKVSFPEIWIDLCLERGDVELKEIYGRACVEVQVSANVLPVNLMRVKEYSRIVVKSKQEKKRGNPHADGLISGGMGRGNWKK